MNSEAALRFNPLSFRAKARQHKTLGHVSLCLSEAPPASTSTCSAQQLALHSLTCYDWLPSRTQLTLHFIFDRNFFFTPVVQVQEQVVCKYIHFEMNFEALDVCPGESLWNISLGSSGGGGARLPARCPPVGFFNMTRPSLVLFATHLLIQPWWSILDGASGGKIHHWNVFVPLRKWKVRSELFNPNSCLIWLTIVIL